MLWLHPSLSRETSNPDVCKHQACRYEGQPPEIVNYILTVSCGLACFVGVFSGTSHLRHTSVVFHVAPTSDQSDNGPTKRKHALPRLQPSDSLSIQPLTSGESCRSSGLDNGQFQVDLIRDHRPIETVNVELP